MRWSGPFTVQQNLTLKHSSEMQQMCARSSVCCLRRIKLCMQIITVFRRDEVEGAAPMPKLIQCDYVRTVRAGLLDESIGECLLDAASLKLGQMEFVEVACHSFPGRLISARSHLLSVLAGSTAAISGWVWSSLRSCKSLFDLA